MSENTGPGEDPLSDFEVPDDLSGLLDAGSVEVEFAALITQIAGAEPLAAACSLAQVAAEAVPTDVGALAVLADRAPGAPAKAAEGLSGLIKGVPLILVTRHQGQLTMTRYQDGVAGDQLAPGLVLSGASGVVEDLLVGTKSPADVDGAVSSASISRWKAMRMLTSAARRARRK